MKYRVEELLFLFSGCEKSSKNNETLQVPLAYQEKKEYFWKRNSLQYRSCQKILATPHFSFLYLRPMAKMWSCPCVTEVGRVTLFTVFPDFIGVDV
jgi:hypothetical protein